jgi:hypothetical protein
MLAVVLREVVRAARGLAAQIEEAVMKARMGSRARRNRERFYRV